MEDGGILDGQLSASTVHHVNNGPENARLNFDPNSPKKGCWSAGVNHLDISQWIQVDLLEETVVSGIVLQGREDCCNQWVTKYKMQFSNDGVNWQYLKDGENLDAVSI